MPEAYDTLSGAMPTKAEQEGQPRQEDPALHDVIGSYQELAGEDFPWIGYMNLPKLDEPMDPSTEVGRKDIFRRAAAATNFMAHQSNFVPQAQEQLQAAQAQGRVLDAEDIDRKLGQWYQELNQQRWLAESMQMLSAPGAWEALPEESKLQVYKALGQEMVPLFQREPIQTSYRPGQSDKEPGFLRLLTPVSDRRIQHAAPYRADVAVAVMKQYGPSILQSADRHGVDPLLMAVQIAQESEGDPEAISHANAVGLTQFIGSTWNMFMPENQVPRAMRGERHDANGLVVGGPKDPRMNPELAIEAQAAYLKKLLDKHGGNVAAGVSEYNAGGWSISQAVTGRREFPDETKNYYPSILTAYEHLAPQREELLRQAESSVSARR